MKPDWKGYKAAYSRNCTESYKLVQTEEIHECFTCLQYHLHAVQENHQGFRTEITFVVFSKLFSIGRTTPLFLYPRRSLDQKAKGAKCGRFSCATCHESCKGLRTSRAQRYGWWPCQQSTMNGHMNKPRETHLDFSSHNHHLLVFIRPSNTATLSSSNNHLCSLHPPHVHIY